MSHEPYPKTDRVTPGSTPGEESRPNSELERQRAEGGMPGATTRDYLHEDEDTDEEEHDAARRERGEEDSSAHEVPPTESVPEGTAREAARSVDPASAAHGRDVEHEDPMRRGSASSDVSGVPREEH